MMRTINLEKVLSLIFTSICFSSLFETLILGLLNLSSEFLSFVLMISILKIFPKFGFLRYEYTFK